jgi:hypothetical protein
LDALPGEFRTTGWRLSWTMAAGGEQDDVALNGVMMAGMSLEALDAVVWEGLGTGHPMEPVEAVTQALRQLALAGAEATQKDCYRNRRRCSVVHGGGEADLPASAGQERPNRRQGDSASDPMLASGTAGRAGAEPSGSKACGDSVRPSATAALRAQWLAPLIEELGDVLASEGTDEVQQRMSRRHMAPDNTLVITRELLGGDLDDARRTVADHLGTPSNRTARKLTEAAARYAAELAGDRSAGGAGG